jgi:hypothetical protein
MEMSQYVDGRGARYPVVLVHGYASLTRELIRSEALTAPTARAATAQAGAFRAARAA